MLIGILNIFSKTGFMWLYCIDSLSILKSRNAFIRHTEIVLKHSELSRGFPEENTIYDN